MFEEMIKPAAIKGMMFDAVGDRMINRRQSS